MKTTITDSFWRAEQELVRKEVIPYQWNALNDQVEGATPSYCMRNFRLAGQINQKRTAADYVEKKYPIPRDKWEYLPDNSAENSFHGFVFQDTDLYKWLEAVGYSLMNHPDPELEKLADQAIDAIAAAQLENGYLDTLYIINNPSQIFTDLRDKHELYCFGHLCEGAIAYYHATGKRKIIDVSIRFADYIYQWFVEGNVPGYPGHEIAEMALAKLYKETGDKKYLELAEFFVDHRGEQPYYFDIERQKKLDEDEMMAPPMFYDKEKTELKYQYNQAHLPVRQQKEAIGHAVRAVYLYSGLADLAALSGDESLKTACRDLFTNIVEKKMYITGGIGSTHVGEAFTVAYDLPNALAYSETCAAIGLVFFAYRMLLMEPKSIYADTMERALYNNVISGMAADGKSFFYVNPLEVNPGRVHGDERLSFVKTTRQKWFGCACCPPNIARLLSSLGSYITSEDKEHAYVHLFIGSGIEFSDDKGSLKMDADLKKSGTVKMQITHQKDYRLGIRIPWWGKTYQISDGGEQLKDIEVADGYLYINVTKDMALTIDFDLKIQLIGCSAKVPENMGKAAVMYGPFVYCLEEKDNGSGLHLMEMRKNAELHFEDEVICAKGRRMVDESQELYEIYHENLYEDVDLKFVPYYSWANRGENEMTVYVRMEQ